MVGMSSRSLAGQVAVITGASRGIGLQVALHLSALGTDPDYRRLRLVSD